MNNEEMYRRWEKEERISKTSMKIYYFILFLVIGFLIVSAVIFLRNGLFSYEFYACLNILYEILISNIGVTAVITIAALGFTALYSHRNRELINFIIIAVSSFGMAVVVILSYCRFSGSTTLIPVDDNHMYRGRIVGGVADGFGEIFDELTGEREYIGYFRMNQKNGFGISFSSSDDGNRYIKYIGEFGDGNYNGEGYEFVYNLKYENSDDENNYATILEKNNKLDELNRKIESELDQENLTHCMLRYEGTYAKGLKDGHGNYYNITEDGKRYLRYSGDFSEGLYEGNGALYTFSDAGLNYKSFEGGFLDGLAEGNGIIYELSESGEPYKSFEGNFSAGLAEGYGTIYKLSKSGSIYISYAGEFVNNMRDGKGSAYRITDSGERYLVYEGDFKEGHFEGEGKYYEMSDSGELRLVYEGGFKAGDYEGVGVWYAEDGSRYEGEFHEGWCHGHGIDYDSQGNIVFNGNYIEGARQ